MISYKEFYFWLEGFMTNREWTEIREIDIESIKEKMKEVSETTNDNKSYMGDYLGTKRREILGENWNTHPYKPAGPKIIFHNEDQQTVDKYERYD
jgi:hypothetical protein